MTDDGAAFPGGPADTPALFRRRESYLGFRAFGDHAGTVLIDPRVARELRSSAEFATQGHQFAGGLLYGRRWVDDEGSYLVVSGFLEAPRESGGDWVPADRSGDFGRAGAASFTGDFTLTDADLRAVREEAGRMYAASLEVGWWRTRPTLADFRPGDLVTQAELVAPGGVGLLVCGSGPHWGTAYLGPDGHAPDTAGTLVAASDEGEPDDDDPTLDDIAGDGTGLEQPPLDGSLPGAGPVPEFADRAFAGDPPRPTSLPPADPAPGTAVATRRAAMLARRPRPGAVDVSSRDWYLRPPAAGFAGPRMPTDAKVVIGAALLAVIGAAVLIGVLVANAIIAVIVGVVFVLVVFGFVWMSRL
jgi:hypothetical protein